MTGGKILWAMDEAGEIGKRPALAHNEFEISGESYCALMADVRARSIPRPAKAAKKPAARRIRK